jgi:hypothetical protein
MNMYENPSAGKFGPPPENARRERELERGGPRFGTRKEWLVLALHTAGLAYLVMKFAWFRSGTGRTAAILALLAATLFVAQHIVGRQSRDEREGPEPYSAPTRITR